ncbi:hypothetical protein D932_00645 [Enterococcus casseliflavus 14-MB-W-14]|nr:hypothetical protein D932_00645 [Enterococcus casseliflavus 14-MB-W-14]
MKSDAFFLSNQCSSMAYLFTKLYTSLFFASFSWADFFTLFLI